MEWFQRIVLTFFSLIILSANSFAQENVCLTNGESSAYLSKDSKYFADSRQGKYILHADRIVRIAIGEWPPYLSKDLKHFGVVSRFITEAFALEKIKVKYDFFPWKRSFVLAEIGEWDGTAPWSENPERKKKFYFSSPIINENLVFFHMKDYHFDWKTYEDLKGITIGATFGYSYGQEFNTAEKEGRIKVERVYKDELNISKLINKRIDLFICNLETGYGMIYKMYPAETANLFTNHCKPVESRPLHLLLSKKDAKNEALITKFNNGLERLKKSGKYEQYLAESRRGDYIIEK